LPIPTPNWTPAGPVAPGHLLPGAWFLRLLHVCFDCDRLAKCPANDSMLPVGFLVLLLVLSIHALQLPLLHSNKHDKHDKHGKHGKQKLPSAKEFQVHQLPKLDMKSAPEGFQQWAGMMPINDGHHGHLFFWFFKAQVNTTGSAERNTTGSSKKLVIWLNGGPGCSSMLGLLAGHSPIRLQPDGGLKWNEHSWTKHANVLCTSPTWEG